MQKYKLFSTFLHFLPKFSTLFSTRPPQCNKTHPGSLIDEAARMVFNMYFSILKLHLGLLVRLAALLCREAHNVAFDGCFDGAAQT